MDFDIGNILYVVITLVAIIASLLGRKKKPGGKQSKPGFLENLDKILKMGQEDPTPITLQDFEPDMEAESEESDTEFVPEVSGIMDKAPSLMEEYEMLLKNRGGSLVEEMHYEGDDSADSIEVVDLDDEGGADYSNIVRDFDAKTAVVYSAIINRLEY